MSSKMSTALSILIESTKDSFLAKLSDKNMSFEAEAGFALQALSSDYSMNLALGNKQSVIDAVTNVAAMGLSLNPAKKQAYLVPRDGKICLDISYMGLIDIAVATGSIMWAQAAVVYRNDTYEPNGLDVAPTHKYHPFGNDRGEKDGVYVVVKTPSGDYLTHTMSIAEVYAIRARSQSYKAHLKDKKQTIWITDEDEMIKKTCVKQAYKYWPKTSEAFKQALHYLNVEAGEGLAEINLQPVRRGAPPPVVVEIDYAEQARLVGLLELSAKNGTEAFKASWFMLEEEQKRLVGIAERNRINSLADAKNKPVTVEHEVIKNEANNG